MPWRVSTANPRVPHGLPLPENRRGPVNASLHEVMGEDRHCCSCDPCCVTTLCRRHSKALNCVWCPRNSNCVWCPRNSTEFHKALNCVWCPLSPEFAEFGIPMPAQDSSAFIQNPYPMCYDLPGPFVQWHRRPPLVGDTIFDFTPIGIPDSNSSTTISSPSILTG